jgi:hypothetical protein
VADDLALWTPEAGVRVVAAIHAFQSERVELELPAGATLAEMAEQVGIPAWASAHAWIDDWLIPKQAWAHVRPRAGRRVTFRVVPSGGGGGNDKNKTLRLVLTLVVLVVAAVVGYYLGPLVGGIVSVIGMAAIAYLLPFPKPKLSALADPFQGGQASPTYSLTGSRNQLAPYRSVPRVYGRHRIYPPLGSFPVTQSYVTEQDLHQTFCFGYGPLALTEFKIGDTAISEFAGVQLEVREGWASDPPLTIVQNVRFEEPLNVTLEDGVPSVRAARPEADQISIDVTFPGGIWYPLASEPSGLKGVAFDIYVDVRALNPDGSPAGSGTWSNVVVWHFYEARRETLRMTSPVPVPYGGYWDVRVTKGGPTPVVADTVDTAVWSAIRSTRFQEPMPVGGMAKAALVIRASGELSGVVDQFNAVATSWLTEWDGAAWQFVQSRNPGAVFLDILRGSANARPVRDVEIDWPTLQDWMVECRAKGYTFDAVLDSQMTVYEALQLVAAAGRASFSMRDGKYSVVRDRPQTVPVQFFTPRNSSNYTGAKAFEDLPHALKIKFINPAANWQLDERVVYDDGYDEVTATKFQGLELFGCTSPDLAWRHGRYWLAAARLRPEVHELSTDIEYLVANRGDLVHVNHDVPLWGVASARVLSVEGQLVVIDELLDQYPATGTMLAMRVRLQTGSFLLTNVTLVPDPPTRTSQLWAATAAELAGVAPGDLLMLGTIGQETIPCVIRQISPGDNFSAKLSLVDAAPAIQNADTGPIPPWVSNITRPPAFNRPPPLVPVIYSIRSDETVLLAGDPYILVTFTPPASTYAVPTTHYQGQLRAAGSQGNWIDLPSVTLPSDHFLIGPVIEGGHYDLRFRAINDALSRASAWVEVLDYKVEGGLAPPPDPIALTIDFTWDELRWQYPDLPNDFFGFQVRYAAGVVSDWALTSPLHGAYVSDTRFHLPPLDGRYTFMVKAFDTGLRESVHPARLVADLLAVPGNILAEIDYGAAGYPGTVVALTRVLAPPPPQLCSIAATDPLVWSSTGDPLAWTTGNAVYWGAGHGPGSYLVTVTPPPEHAGAAMYWRWSATGPGWIFEYRSGGDSLYWTTDPAAVWTTDPAPAWTPTAGWLPWPGVIMATAQQYDFRWSYLGDGGSCLVEAVLGYEVPDIDLYYWDVPVAAGGTRLVPTQPMVAVTAVLLTAQMETADPLLIPTVLDKDPVAGPLVQVRRASDGVAVAGVVDAHVRGY